MDFESATLTIRAGAGFDAGAVIVALDQAGFGATVK